MDVKKDGEELMYVDERFADVQILRYYVRGYDDLTDEQKLYTYYLADAMKWGRDIIYDQNCKYNLKIRTALEAIYTDGHTDRDSGEYKALELYLKQVWFANGIHHHYSMDKFVPGFSEGYFRRVAPAACKRMLPHLGADEIDAMIDEISPVIFDPQMMAKRVNKAPGCDLVATSACNYYDGVKQEEAERFYAEKKASWTKNAPSFGLNSRLVKDENGIHEEVWGRHGKYGKLIDKICINLEKARQYAENDQQRKVIDLLVKYYETGDLSVFDDYSIEWLKETEGKIDFINGFIEVYGDPLGLKGSWEGLLEMVDEEATKRCQKISDNAQWFEDHSPVDERFRKAEVKGVVAKAVQALALGGDEYPSTAIGINLPNADWIRAQHGSKSVTISNITEAYNVAARGNGMLEEFVCDELTVKMIRRYGDRCDELHTDLHECLGHGSGQLLPGTDPDALKAYGNTIEEARADLFALYYIADEKLVELGLLEDREAYKSNYYTYMMNGLMTQLVRIKPGCQIEEAHMRNRALIARWCMANGDAVRMVKRDGKTVVVVNDYEGLRQQIAQLLAEVQRIKSEGDYDAAKALVEEYGVKIDPQLHEEVLDRYHRLDIAPYKGFLNPDFIVGGDTRQEEPTLKTAKDIRLSYKTTFVEQMLEYSRRYNGN